MADIVDVAKAVAGALNGAIAGLGAAVVFKTDVEREELSGRLVYVVPAARRVAPADRATNVHEIAIDVGVFRPIADTSDVDDIEAGLDDVQAIVALFDEGGVLRRTRMAGCGWRGIDNDPAWSPDHLERHIFASRIRLTYAKTR